MFMVNEAEATAIRAAYERGERAREGGGELAAAAELCRLFPGIADQVKAREAARTIAGWKPLPLPARVKRRS